MTTVAVLYIDPNGPYPTLAKSIVSCTWFDNYRAHDTAVGPCACGAWHQLDCWDATRDARLYDGPHPIVAHPPCKHWGRLRHLAKVECGGCKWRGREAQLGHAPGIGPYCPLCACDYIVSDADCAPRAVEQVRRWGGVLEHPAGSKLWEHRLATRSELPYPRDRYLAGKRTFDLSGASCADSFGGYTIEVDQVEWGHVARKRTWLYLVGVPREALEEPPFPGREPTHHVSRDSARARRNGYTLKRTSSAQNYCTPPLFAEYLIRLARSVQCKI